MAVIAHLETEFGESRDLYVRLNNFEQLANHGVPAVARFRGYLSEEAFRGGRGFVWEMLVPFDADAPAEPWQLAYAALRAHDAAAPIAADIAALDAMAAELAAKLDAIDAANEPDGAAARASIESHIATLVAQRPALVTEHEAAAARSAALSAATEA